MEQKTVLIIGVSSFVGSNLAEYFSKKYKVVGTYYSNPVSIPGVLSIPCDVLNKDEIQVILYTFRPDYTIYCAGLTSIEDSSKNETLSDSLNTVGLVNVSELCQRYKSQICYLSSAFVFSGNERPYTETDIPDSSIIYGRNKASSEFYLQKTSLNYLIFRCSLLYGRSANFLQYTWFENLQRKFLLKKSFSCDDKLKIGFLDVFYLAQVIHLSFEKKITNRLFQVSSIDSMTHYEFATNYSNTFNETSEMAARGRWYFPQKVSEGTQHHGGLQSLTFSMDISNIEGFLNIKLPTIKESLKFTLKRLYGTENKVSRQKSDGVKYI